MKRSEAYLFILGLCPLVALPLLIGIRTLLASKERIIVPLLRMKTKTGDQLAITYKRSICRPAATTRRPYVIAAPAKFTQPGSIL